MDERLFADTLELIVQISELLAKLEAYGNRLIHFISEEGGDQYVRSSEAPGSYGDGCHCVGLGVSGRELDFGC